MQKIIYTIAIAMLLASCSSKIKQKVGMEDIAPDELQVEKQRPLYVPPHYDLPEPPAPQLGASEVKQKSSWMFWKKDKIEPEQKIKLRSEEVVQKPADAPKKKWFWQKDKTEAVVESKASTERKLDKPASALGKKKPFWKREKKVVTSEVAIEKK